MGVSYKDLGLVNTREMFAKAMEGSTLYLLIILIILSSFRLLSPPVWSQSLRLSFRYPRVRENTQMLRCSAIWLWELLNIPKNWAAIYL